MSKHVFFNPTVPNLSDAPRCNASNDESDPNSEGMVPVSIFPPKNNILLVIIHCEFIAPLPQLDTNRVYDQTYSAKTLQEQRVYSTLLVSCQSTRFDLHHHQNITDKILVKIE